VVVEGSCSDAGVLYVEFDDEDTIRLVGELDVISAHVLFASYNLVTHSTVVIDASGLTFIDASGIGAIITAAHGLRKEGDDLKVRGARGIVRRVFELTGQAGLLSD
jgi:anti-anti-sigma factor